MEENVKIVPALCTQCGGSVEVNSASEKATCPFCGASFIVEKAINNYNVQHATIEHADNVNIDMRGAVKDVLGFVGEQMNESRVQRQQMKKIEAEKDKLITVTFLKVFGLVMVAMMVFGIIASIILNLTDRSDGDTVADPAEQTMTSSEESQMNYYVEDGCLYIDVIGENIGEWACLESKSSCVWLDSEDNADDGYHSCISAAITDGTGYVVTAAYAYNGIADGEDPLFYSVIHVTIQNSEIIEAVSDNYYDELPVGGF